MKKIPLFVVACMAGLTVMAQQVPDPVLMHINGEPVLRSEFEYSYNKNNAEGVLDKKSVEDYVPLFVDFKLKVLAAKEAGVDTLSSIRRELQGYRNQMVVSDLVDTAYIEREARRTYETTASRFAGADMLNASHILVRLAQNASKDDEAKAKARIDSISQALKDGADFAQLAKTCSDDKASGQRGGELGQFGKGMMIPDFEKAAYALKVGEVSAPVKSTVGWHIIKLNDRHPFEPYEYHRPQILKFLEQRGIREASANALIDSLAARQGVDRDVVIGQYYDKILAGDRDKRYLAQEYTDGTLMFEISKSQIWDKAQADEKGLAEYFKAHKKKYKWDEPRYKGMVVHAVDQAAVKKAQAKINVLKKTKKNEEGQWPKAIAEEMNTDSVQAVRIEYGLFKKGMNKAVDKMGFRLKDTKFVAPKKYPETFVQGKILKKPASYTDVQGEVTTDYQNECERQWVEQLRKKYTVTVEQEVLKTVNKH